jgi:hypothetical protein
VTDAYNPGKGFTFVSGGYGSRKGGGYGFGMFYSLLVPVDLILRLVI